MKIKCAGGLFLAKDTKRFLFLQRTQPKTFGNWGLVGGKTEPEDNTPYNTLMREISEELGKTPPIKKFVPLEVYLSNDETFQYDTYVLIVEKEFIPTLNSEHDGYAWVNLNSWPVPLHRGLKKSLTNKIIKSKLELIIDLI